MCKTLRSIPRSKYEEMTSMKPFLYFNLNYIVFSTYFYDNETFYIFDENEYLHSFTEDFKFFKCCRFGALFCYTDA